MATPHLKHIRLSHRLENKNILCIDLYLGSIPAQMLDFSGVIAKIVSRCSRKCTVGMIPTSIQNLLTHLV